MRQYSPRYDDAVCKRAIVCAHVSNRLSQTGEVLCARSHTRLHVRNIGKKTAPYICIPSLFSTQDACSFSSGRFSPASLSLPDIMASQHLWTLLPLIYLVLLFARALPAYGVCYRSDGLLDMVPRPCPGSNMCCYLDRTDGYADDVCIQGACYSDYWKGQYFVVACTHQNWDEEGSGCSPLWDACGTHHHQNLLPRSTDCKCQVVNQITPTSRTVPMAAFAAAQATLHVAATILVYM